MILDFLVFMTLYLIGLGLWDEKDISLRGLEAVKQCEKVYLEYYTSKLNCRVNDLEKLYNKKIVLADREFTEKQAENTLLKEAKSKDVALLIIGDPFSATTHIDLILRARKNKVKVNIINNASVMNAVGITGLELYKFGKTTSIPFEEKNFQPETPYNAVKENKKSGLHTLLLLDLRPNENKYMTINQAIEYLLKLESRKKENVFSENTLCVGCARLGSDKPKIIAGKAKDLLNENFGKPLHCLIVPGKLHFIEEEALEMWK